MQSAIKFLKHRNETYLPTPENKQQEETVIKHILRANKYNTSTANRITNNHQCDNGPENPKKWTKFTFVGPTVRFITNLFNVDERAYTSRVEPNTVHL
jgi:hypothetical protein